MTAPALAVNVRGKGRHYEHPETGELVPSVTNIIGILDKPAIPRWAAKTVAEQAWKLRYTLDDLGQAEAIDVLKGSPWRQSRRSADRGTSIHEYLEARASGITPDILGGEAKTYQQAADEFLEIHQPEFNLTEFTVFGDGYAGTGDFIADMHGRLVLGDFKTSKALYPEIALQLAALRNAREVVVGGVLEPMWAVDGCVGVLLTPDGCDVQEIDTEGAYEAFRGLLAAWHWKQAGVDMKQMLWRAS